MSLLLGAFGPLHLLVVDDDPIIQIILEGHYTALGFSVVTANNGQEALQAFKQRIPDIILCDRVMPEMSGAEFLTALREGKEDLSKTVFVFLTALTDRRDRYAMMELGPDGFLDKPVDFAHADQALSKLLEKKRGAPPSA